MDLGAAPSDANRHTHLLTATNPIRVAIQGSVGKGISITLRAVHVLLEAWGIVRRARMNADAPMRVRSRSGAKGQRMYCTDCGTPLLADARFCTRCGRPRDTQAVAAVDDGKPRERVIDVVLDFSGSKGSTQPGIPIAEVVVPANRTNYRPDGIGLANPRIVTTSDRYTPPVPKRATASQTITVLVVLFALLAWAGNLSATRNGAPREGQAASASPQTAATAVPATVSNEVKAEAVALLGSAIYKVEEGNLALAIEQAKQAQEKWPAYPDAANFIADVTPKATATAAAVQARATAAAAAPGGSAAGLLSERDAIARVLPSVVHIATKSSVGTGYVVRDNLIATNAHVVSTNPTAEVRTQDGKTLIGQVVARDAKQDIALIKLPASRLPVVTLAKSKALRPGDTLMAVGYALDLRGGPSITRGVYSTHRTMQGVTYVQTDAPLNPGNSGGPLVSLRGEVVGMNTMGLKNDFGTDVRGLYFAVAIEAVQAIVVTIPK